MGAAIARGMKQVKSADGNGNFEQVNTKLNLLYSVLIPLVQCGTGGGSGSGCQVIASHPLPVRVDMALDQPPAERAEQVSYLVLTSANQC